MIIVKKIFETKNLRWILYGALFFWIPDILIHAIKRYEFDNPILASLVCPIVLIAGYFIAAYFSDQRISALQPGLILVGIWCAGGFAIMIASSFAGGGFLNPDGWHIAVGLSLLAIIVPPLTLMMTTYDGTLFAILGATLLMILEMSVLSGRIIQFRFPKAAA